MEKNIIGKSSAEIRTAGWRIVRSTERCAIAATCTGSVEPILGLRLLCPSLPGALERASRLLQEHVVQGRLVEPQVGDLEVFGIEGAHHVGEAACPLIEPHGDGARLSGNLLPEAPQGPCHSLAFLEV